MKPITYANSVATSRLEEPPDGNLTSHQGDASATVPFIAEEVEEWWACYYPSAEAVWNKGPDDSSYESRCLNHYPSQGERNDDAPNSKRDELEDSPLFASEMLLDEDNTFHRGKDKPKARAERDTIDYAYKDSYQMQILRKRGEIEQDSRTDLSVASRHWQAHPAEWTLDNDMDDRAKMPFFDDMRIHCGYLILNKKSSLVLGPPNSVLEYLLAGGYMKWSPESQWFLTLDYLGSRAPRTAFLSVWSPLSLLTLFLDDMRTKRKLLGVNEEKSWLDRSSISATSPDTFNELFEWGRIKWNTRQLLQFLWIPLSDMLASLTYRLIAWFDTGWRILRLLQRLCVVKDLLKSLISADPFSN